MDKLKSPKRKLIFQQFLYKKSLSFSSIEKVTGIRSNELAYFLQMLVKDNILEKKGDKYSLSEEAEKYIPFFVNSDDKLSPLPVVLVACIKDGKVLLHKREKRPYEGLWSLPGGRIRVSETVKEASARVLKDISFVDCRFRSYNALVNEKHISGEVLHGFIIIFVRVEPTNLITDKDDVRYFPIKKLPGDMIPSDAWLVRNALESNVEIIEEKIIEDDGFRMVKE